MAGVLNESVLPTSRAPNCLYPQMFTDLFWWWWRRGQSAPKQSVKEGYELMTRRVNTLCPTGTDSIKTGVERKADWTHDSGTDQIIWKSLAFCRSSQSVLLCCCKGEIGCFSWLWSIILPETHFTERCMSLCWHQRLKNISTEPNLVSHRYVQLSSLLKGFHSYYEAVNRRVI